MKKDRQTDRQTRGGRSTFLYHNVQINRLTQENDYKCIKYRIYWVMSTCVP